MNANAMNANTMPAGSIPVEATGTLGAQDDGSPPPLRLAVVGVGPKGLYVLERLAVELASGALLGPVDCYLFEPHPYPGAGPVYDPRQPHFLRLNFANRCVDLWSPNRPSTAPGLDLVQWLRHHRPSLANPQGYAPRAVVGEYLHDGFQRVARELRRFGKVRWLRQAVSSIEGRDGAWKVRSDDLQVVVDEVVLCTGHDSRRGPSSEPHGRVIPAVFPVGEQLSTERVPPASQVAIRGFGLTALDATLALFEGRGGRFHLDGATSSLAYRSAEDEVAVVVPFCRSGRPMIPKPDPQRSPTPAGLEALWTDGGARLRHLVADGGPLPMEGLYDILLHTACGALASARIEDKASYAKAEVIDRLTARLKFLCTQPRGRFLGEPIAAALSRSLKVAYGERPRDDEWALGAAWRGLYPSLVEVVGRGGGFAPNRRAFERLAVEMERLAFGPPAENAARFLALVRSGKVDLSWLDDPQVELTAERPQLRRNQDPGRGEARSVDVLVHAVLAPPGIAPQSAPLFEQLLRDGSVRLAADTDGVEINAQGQAVASNGQSAASLAVFGRPTEGCVLGNDTLSRTLHPHIAAWASGLAGRHLRRQEKLP